MRSTRHTALSIAVVMAAVTLIPDVAMAQTYPVKPVTIIVPFAAGGPSDAIARILGERMRQTLGQPFLVENVTGAGGSIGVGRAVRAPADGYTISYGHLGTHVFNGAIYSLPYDMLTDLEPLALLPSNPMVVVSKTAVPAKTLSELIAWIRDNRGKVTAGTAGVGSGAHVAGVYFADLAKVELQYVPYRGTGPALNDLSRARSISSLIRPRTRCSRFAPARSAPMRSATKSGWQRRPRFRPRSRQACPNFR